ncbi:MAG: SDR family NAD(P)-dependent oxidoreductase [Parasphingorhabdus sp.]|uniref:SDR family NAD(P)-dependent oxidoreductase n=1 Tax=Parasphingorhabdus sp. TaxID=2709688 RepID=UPI0030012FA4
MIIVTGAAGILGQAVVKELSAAGYSVAAVDLASEIADAGQGLSKTGVDLTRADAVRTAFEAIVLEAGSLSGLVNVAGGFIWETIADGSLDSWDRMYAMNVQTAVNGCAAALPYLRKDGGAIVNIAANGAVRADTGMAAYAASKSGVMRLTEALAKEELHNGIRVNAVMPSIIDTPANRKDMPDAKFSDWVSTKSLADVIGFLLSDKANAVTGACLPVTGRC